MKPVFQTQWRKRKYILSTQNYLFEIIMKIKRREKDKLTTERANSLKYNNSKFIIDTWLWRLYKRNKRTMLQIQGILYYYFEWERPICCFNYQPSSFLVEFCNISYVYIKREHISYLRAATSCIPQMYCPIVTSSHKKVTTNSRIIKNSQHLVLQFQRWRISPYTYKTKHKDA